MIVFRLETPLGDVQVSLRSEKPDQRAPLEYSGASSAADVVRFWLAAEPATGGRVLGRGATPRELERAMQKATREVATQVIRER
jgi:hypothetical protein